jgi:hypothetical protein
MYDCKLLLFSEVIAKLFLTFRQLNKILQQLQSNLLAFFRVKLRVKFHLIVLAASKKQIADFGAGFAQLGIFHFASGVKNHGLFDGEQAVWTNETVHGQPSAFKIGNGQWNGISIGARLAGNLAEDQIVAGQIGHDKGRAAFARLQVGLWKRQDNNFAD